MTGAAGRSGKFSLGMDGTFQDGLPELPAGLSAEATVKWFELLDQLPAHTLRRCDVHELRILSELLAHSDRLAAGMAGDPTDLKTSRLYIQVGQHIHRLSGAFGLNPADRKRMGTDPSNEPDALDEWMAL